MQKYTYHCHTNSLGIFDGNNSADEMISRAEELGFAEIGISNHMICHPSIGYINKMQNMYFRDYKVAEDIYKRTVDDIRTASLKHKIKVWVGFEVDYFHDSEWCRFFERLKNKLEADYYIGSSHFIYNHNYNNILKIAYLKHNPEYIDDEMRREGLQMHWENIKNCAASGYFDFIAHMDQIKSKGFCGGSEWDDAKYKVIEALAAGKTGFELSTKGLRKNDEMYPAAWIVKELNKRDVPVVISDDAHRIEQIGENFAIAESLLEELHYQNRFKL